MNKVKEIGYKALFLITFIIGYLLWALSMVTMTISIVVLRWGSDLMVEFSDDELDKLWDEMTDNAASMMDDFRSAFLDIKIEL